MIDLEKPQWIEWMDGTVRCRDLHPDYKRALLLYYARRFGLTTFVETGTFQGDTLATVRPYFDRLFSIELAPQLYAAAFARFHECAEINLICGDSARMLPWLLSTAPPARTLFWLDAHCSGGFTAGTNPTPLAAELEAILLSGWPAVVLVDDLQEWRGHDWLQVAQGVLQKYPQWKQEIRFGILRIFSPEIGEAR
jgi:hypothetical protein